MENQQVGLQRRPLSDGEAVALRVASQTSRVLMHCSACKELLYGQDCIRNLQVCFQCDYHFPLTAHERIDLLVDAGSFLDVDADLQTTSPLVFNGHTLRGWESGGEEGPKGRHQEAIVIGCASIEGRPVVLAVMDARFRDSKGGMASGEKIRCAVERAIERQVPLLICCASSEACMREEGGWWLGLASTAAALGRLGDAHLPCFSVLTNPSIGVASGVAMLADVILAEPGCQVCFVHPHGVEEGMLPLLPAGTFTAEGKLQHGFIDAIVHRRELRKTVARLLRMYLCDHP